MRNPVKHAGAEVAAEDGDQADPGERGQQHLRAAADHDPPPHAGQPAEGELDADGEQQQDHADLGDGLHGALPGDEAELGRADDDPGEQEAHDRHHAQPHAEVPDRGGGDHEDGGGPEVLGNPGLCREHGLGGGHGPGGEHGPGTHHASHAARPGRDCTTGAEPPL
ncbi:MAG: hypothetical protein NTW05_08860 [Pseudonocardiales bacterium]|nr:hypothetical protein [Pseudonocardiales bacterium]